MGNGEDAPCDRNADPKLLQRDTDHYRGPLWPLARHYCHGKSTLGMMMGQSMMMMTAANQDTQLYVLMEVKIAKSCYAEDI